MTQNTKAEHKTERKAKRKGFSWKTQLIVVAAVGAVAGVGRFLWWRTKRAARSAM